MRWRRASDHLAEWDFQILHITGRGKAVLDENGEPLSPELPSD